MVALSIVYAVRDPDYGQGLARRMQVSLNALAGLAAECRLDYELIVVEWNPPAGKPTLRESISCPPAARGRVRFIEVPAQLHERLGAAPELPFLEYVAKNAGIRRAAGDWVLATSPDDIFNKPLVRFLAKSAFEKNAYYRADRYDVSGTIAAQVTWHDALAHCGRTVFVVHGAEGSVAQRPGRPRGGAALRHRQPAPLHTNASGDFFLMSRRNWFDLRGYTELTTHAHIDSIMCWTAVSAGLREIVLGGRTRLYHQHHDRSLHAGFPLTDWQQWQQRYFEAMARRERLMVNGDDWGLAGESLAEFAAK